MEETSVDHFDEQYGWNIVSKTVEQLQTAMGDYNSKTVDFEAFKTYVSKKNQLNHELEQFYFQPVFRLFRWYAFINTQRSEAKMVNRFRAKFGPPETTIICIGDWSSSPHQMRFHEPTKGKGWRKVFRKAGYQVYLVRESYTSKRCFNCKDPDAECKKFRNVVNPRPWKKNIVLRNGLIRCNKCNTLWNRDLNGSLNIYHIADCYIRGLGRPVYLEQSTAITRLISAFNRLGL
jgi:hypothetical protein